MSHFYKNIPNRVQIESILKPYDMKECMSDSEFFGEFYLDLVDEYPNVPNLQMVLERMLVASLEKKKVLRCSIKL